MNKILDLYYHLDNPYHYTIKIYFQSLWTSTELKNIFYFYENTFIYKALEVKSFLLKEKQIPLNLHSSW